MASKSSLAVPTYAHGSTSGLRRLGQIERFSQEEVRNHWTTQAENRDETRGERMRLFLIGAEEYIEMAIPYTLVYSEF